MQPRRTVLVKPRIRLHERYARKCETLTPLRKALACIQDLKTNPWEFAVRLMYFIDFDMNISDLHWPVLHEYVDPANDRTTLRSPAPGFQPHANIAVTEKGAFR